MKKSVEAAEDGPDLFIQNDTCPCGGCTTSGKYEKNMSPNGPQTPFRCDLSTFDLFKMLGWLDKDTEKDLMKVCRWSIASFDVESVAARVSDFIGNEDVNFQPEVLSFLRLPREIRAVHEPCRIGFQTQLRLEAGKPVYIFRSDSERSNALEADFLAAVFEQREEAVCAKYEVLLRFFELLEKYRSKHFEFFESKGWLPRGYTGTMFVTGEIAEQEVEEMTRDVISDLARELGSEDSDEEDCRRSDSPLISSCMSSEEEEEEALEDEVVVACVETEEDKAAVKAIAKRKARRISDINKAWEHSLFGILYRRLTFLAHAFNIFGFNGEAFDHVIMFSRLVTHAKEIGRRDVRVQREGSKIRFIILDGVRFCEIKRLLGPGTSLSSLGAACNLEEEKFIFPFRMFTSLAFLEEAELPREAKDWSTDLNPDKSPTQA